MTFTGGGTLAGSGVNCVGAVGLEISGGNATWGTVAGAEMWSGLLQNVSVKKMFTIFEQKQLNNLRTISNHLNIGDWIEGTLTMDVDCGVPLAMGLGYMSATDDPTLKVWRGAGHTAPAKVYLPSWSIKLEYDEATDDNISVLGAMVNRANYSIDLDGAFKATVDFIGKSAGVNAITSVTNPVQSFGSWNTTLKVKEGGTTYADSGAVEITGVKNISFSVNNNLKKRNEWSSRVFTGVDNAGDNKATSMVDTTTNFGEALIGGTLYNKSNGCSGTITSISTTTNTNDTVNCSGGLSGGSEQDFDSGDSYVVDASKRIRQPLFGQADLECRITRGFIDDDFWDDLLDGTVQSFRINTSVPTGTVSSLTIDLQSCFSKEGSHIVSLTDQSEDVGVFSVKDIQCAVVDPVTYVIWGD